MVDGGSSDEVKEEPPLCFWTGANGGSSDGRDEEPPLCFWTGADGGSSDDGEEEPPSMNSHHFPRMEVMSVLCLNSC